MTKSVIKIPLIWLTNQLKALPFFPRKKRTRSVATVDDYILWPVAIDQWPDIRVVFPTTLAHASGRAELQASEPLLAGGRRHDDSRSS
ncbi:hypothetical protein [Pseudomonas sp. GM55]|uniref:hypothetical protein n=1 Tax=Pseudomonas sp. GM55 TaxID=1144333 RepID=UPI0012F9A62C|nr:hypothetical protein [Pseudomonas sp. GM55]